MDYPQGCYPIQYDLDVWEIFSKEPDTDAWCVSLVRSGRPMAFADMIGFFDDLASLTSIRNSDKYDEHIERLFTTLKSYSKTSNVDNIIYISDYDKHK